MNITITGHHLEITDSLRAYIKDKIDKVEGHYDRINQINITLSIEKYLQKAEATLHVTGNDIHADSTKEDMYAAIDDMTDKLDRQIRHYKRKQTDHRY